MPAQKKREWERNVFEVIIDELKGAPRNVLAALALLSDLLPLPLPLPRLCYAGGMDDHVVFPRDADMWLDDGGWLERELVERSEEWREDVSLLLEPLVGTISDACVSVMRSCSELTNITLRRLCCQLADLSPVLAHGATIPFVELFVRVLDLKGPVRRQKLCRALHALSGA